MKKAYYFPIGIIIFLLITNPSLKDFKDHIGVPSDFESRIPINRNHNYFICSSYSVNGSSGRYFAIAGNFFYFKSEKEKSEEYLRTIYTRLNPKLKLGDFDNFKEQLKDKAFRLNVYAEAVIAMHLDDYEEFENRIKLAEN